MSVYFKPDMQNYFSRLSRDMMLADIRQITGKEPSPAQAKMKKNELAACAAKLVQGTNWLPAILRASDASVTAIDEAIQPRLKPKHAA